MREIKNITITPEILKLIAEIDEFKGAPKLSNDPVPKSGSAATTLRALRFH